MFRSGAEEPASGSDGVSRSALFTSPDSEYGGRRVTGAQKSELPHGTPRGSVQVVSPAIHVTYVSACFII